MTVDLSGKSIIITGAGGGIGRATSVLLAEAGAQLLLVDRDSATLETALSAVRDSGGTAATVIADVTKDEDVQGYVAAALSEYGSIDGFFNNAGVEGAVAPTSEVDPADFDKVISVNLRSVFLGMRYVLPVMIKQGSGAIVCTGSIASVLGMPNTMPYNATKHAVLGIVRTAATEVARQGVRVNAVMPGLINTRMLHSLAEDLVAGMSGADGAQEMAKTGSPMGRLGAPGEVGAVVRFLLSDEASFVTGATVAVDGGIMAGPSAS